MSKVDKIFYTIMLLWGVIAILGDSIPLSVIVAALLICWEMGDAAEKINKGGDQ